MQITDSGGCSFKDVQILTFKGWNYNDSIFIEAAETSCLAAGGGHTGRHRTYRRQYGGLLDRWLFGHLGRRGESNRHGH